MTTQCPSLPRLSSAERTLFLKKSLQTKMSMKTKFHSNTIASLHQLLSNTSVHTLLSNQFLFLPEAYTSIGYTMDAELLLDKDNNPIPPPSVSWNWSPDVLKVLCDEGPPPVDNSVIISIAERNNVPSDLVFNLASDWSCVNDKVHRRVCIESDGPIHYTANTCQPLGRTVLKKRQLQALGWEVLQVSWV